MNSSSLSIDADQKKELIDILKQTLYQGESNNCLVCGQHKVWKYGHEEDCPLQKWLSILGEEEIC